jgi:DNA repair exonuclease SbcCD ATPase subunit
MVMARLGVDYETIKQTAVKLLSQGMAPSVQKIREVLGTGSNTTIAEHLKVWREEYAKKTIHYLPPNMPKELISVFEVLWQTAMEQAQNQLAEYKQTVEAQREALLKRELDAEKSVFDIKQKLAEMSNVLELEIAANQKLNVELAVKDERLSKKTEELIEQKNQYEDRLKRVYENKDSVIKQSNQLQNEVRSLQEKISLQTEQHQSSIAQQNVLHEQSENRWVKLIDQAREEVKDTCKKLENFRVVSDDETKKFKATLSDLQQSFHEKNVQLNVALDQINSLKQDRKILQSAIIKSKSAVTKLEEDLKSKNIIISELEKIKQKKEKIHS